MRPTASLLTLELPPLPEAREGSKIADGKAADP